MVEDGPGPDRFRPDELDGDITAAAQAEVMVTARELEWLAATSDFAPTAGFADRVMAAVAAEPTPRPVIAVASAVRRGAIGAVFAGLGDLWRVAWTGGRPLAARAPALALVLILLAGAIGAGAIGVGAMARLVQEPSRTPGPSEIVGPTLTPAPTARPTESASPTPTASPSESADPPDSAPPTEEATPGATPRPARPATARPAAGSPPSATRAPIATPAPTPTPGPTETHDSNEGSRATKAPGPSP